MDTTLQCSKHSQDSVLYCNECQSWICPVCVTEHSSKRHTITHLLDYASTILPEEYTGVYHALTETQTTHGAQCAKIKEQMGLIEEPLAELSRRLIMLGNAVDQMK